MTEATSAAPLCVTLLTREQCHLCDTARTVVRDVCRDLGQPWGEVDVDTDPELRSEYGDQVPVVMVGHEVIATLTVEPISLQHAIAGR